LTSYQEKQDIVVMNSKEAPCLRILLDYTAANPDPEHAVWKPADTLSGRIELSNNDYLVIEEMTVCFEGIAQT
jgi:hypothetical protein